MFEGISKLYNFLKYILCFRILLYGAHDPDKGREVGRISLQAEPVSLVYHGGQVFIGLANGHLNVYNRNLR